MKVCFEQFLGQNHSWSVCGQNLARSFAAKGHEVHLTSTNGLEHFPSDLRHLLRPSLDKDYDAQISYTAMINFPKYLSHGSKNRFGIWNYETTVLPDSFAKYYKSTDKMLPSSNFSKDIFVKNRIPSEHQVVIPHGYDVEAFNTDVKYPLQTKKKYKILANIAQPHIRKNIPGLLEAFGRAFTKDDDVCLVAKVVIKKELTNKFEVSFTKIFENFKKKYPNHAQVEIINKFIPNIAELYNSCDIVFSMTHSECFWLPGLEASAANKLIIVSNYGGQLDFLNNDNSLLVDGKLVLAPRNMQYWSASPYAQMFDPSVEDAAAKLKLGVSNFETLMSKFTPGLQEVKSKYTWGNAVDQIISIMQ